jgi:hypothetical protein
MRCRSQQETYLGHLSKVPDNLRIAVDNFLLYIQSKLSSRLSGVVDPSYVQRLQGVPNVRVRI